MRNMIIALAACTLLAPPRMGTRLIRPPRSQTRLHPTAPVTLKGGSVAAGIGYTWGHGELKYPRRLHQFSIKGVSIVDVGATNYTAAGSVYNLRDLSDFAGNYVAASAGITVAGGGTAVYLKK